MDTTMTKCQAKGCTTQQRYLSKDLCSKHYSRLKRYGDIALVKRVANGTRRFDRDTPEYRAWKSIKVRCYNSKVACYKNYGGRGIKVCDRWRSSYDNFLVDMGRKPIATHSIDRINNDGDYEPSNCRWVDATTQRFNQRSLSNTASGFQCVWKSRKRWTATVRIGGQRNYIGHFMSAENANEAVQAFKRNFYSRKGLIK